MDARVRLAVPCDYPSCGEAAAMVELIPNGERYADGNADILHGIQWDRTSGGTLRISGFLPHTGASWQLADYGGTVEAVGSAGQGAAPVLRGISEDYVPYYCARCARSYCAAHWRLEPVFDENGFDYYFGACPAGHPHMINH